MNKMFSRSFTVPLVLVLTMGLVLVGCGESEHEGDIVESGTYQGTLMEVKPEEKEIYVETEDGRTIELYFTEKTKLVGPNGDTMPFSGLSKNNRVKVKVEKVGQRNDPIRVQLLEE